MEKKIAFIFCLLLVLVMISTSVHGVDTTIELTSSSDLSQLIFGDDFSVNIEIKGVSNFVGGEIIINYDPELLSLNSKSLTLNNMFDFTNISDVNNPNLQDSEGKITFAFGLDKEVEPLSGDFTIGILTFDTLKKYSGIISIDTESKLIYEDTVGNYGKIPYTSSAISYTVLGVGNIVGNVTDNQGQQISNIEVDLIRDGETVFSTTVIDGAFSMENIVEGAYNLYINSSEYEIYSSTVVVEDGLVTNVNIALDKIMPGDVNNDNVVSLEDLVFTANYYGMDSSSPEWNEATSSADVNNDKIIDVLDLIFIYRRITE